MFYDETGVNVSSKLLSHALSAFRNHLTSPIRLSHFAFLTYFVKMLLMKSKLIGRFWEIKYFNQLEFYN